MRAFLLLAAAVALSLGMSYAMATFGHPTALWLWRDMLGFHP